jgi:hypothetical protein
MSSSHDEHIRNFENMHGWILPPLRQCIQRLRDEGRFLHLTMRGLYQLTHIPDPFTLLLQSNDRVETDHLESQIEAAKRDAELVEQETRNEYPMLHKHSVVSIWSALEILCEDLAAVWLQNRPDAWELNPVINLKVQIGAYHNLKPSQRAHYVVRELQRNLRTEFGTGIGRFEPLLSVFGLMPEVGPNLRRAIHELWQVRNNLVHSGGVADETLIESCPWLDFELGEIFAIPHVVYGWYYRASERFTQRVASRAVQMLGFEGCNCPGMDEIDPRPQLQQG